MAVPVITTEGVSLDKVLGEKFSVLSTYSIVASNTPTSYAIASGTIVPGLALDTSTGDIDGTPTQSGRTQINVIASNADGDSDPVAIVFYISKPGCPVITSDLFHDVVAEDPFTYQITATNSPTSYAGQQLIGTLVVDPDTGEITGNFPNQTGTAIVKIIATNATGSSTATDITFYLTGGGSGGGAVPIITSPTSLELTVGESVSYQITADSDTPILSYQVAGPVPVGLSVDVNGLVTSTFVFDEPITFDMDIRATNSEGDGDATVAVSVVPGGGDPDPDPVPGGDDDGSGFGRVYTYTEANTFAEDTRDPCPAEPTSSPPNPPTNLIVITPRIPGSTTATASWTPPTPNLSP